MKKKKRKVNIKYLNSFIALSLLLPIFILCSSFTPLGSLTIGPSLLEDITYTLDGRDNLAFANIIPLFESNYYGADSLNFWIYKSDARSAQTRTYSVIKESNPFYISWNATYSDITAIENIVGPILTGSEIFELGFGTYREDGTRILRQISSFTLSWFRQKNIINDSDTILRFSNVCFKYNQNFEFGMNFLNGNQATYPNITDYPLYINNLIDYLGFSPDFLYFNLIHPCCHYNLNGSTGELRISYPYTTVLTPSKPFNLKGLNYYGDFGGTLSYISQTLPDLQGEYDRGFIAGQSSQSLFPSIIFSVLTGTLTFLTGVGEVNILGFTIWTIIGLMLILSLIKIFTRIFSV